MTLFVPYKFNIDLGHGLYFETWVWLLRLDILENPVQYIIVHDNAYIFDLGNLMLVSVL